MFISSTLIARNTLIGKPEIVKFGLKAGQYYSFVNDFRTEIFYAAVISGFPSGVSFFNHIDRYTNLQALSLLWPEVFRGEEVLPGNESLDRTTAKIDIQLQIEMKPCGLLKIADKPKCSNLNAKTDVFNNIIMICFREPELDNDNHRKNYGPDWQGGHEYKAICFKSSPKDLDTNCDPCDDTSVAFRYRKEYVQI